MVDVLVLNYNDAQTTINFIRNIKDFKNIRKIVVVDNCSTDDSLKRILAFASDKLDVVKTPLNGGYGLGNNFGIRYLIENYRSEYILLSNPDVIVEEETISELERFLKANQDYALAAPFMLDSSGARQVNTCFRIPNMWDYILSFEMIWSKWFSKYFYKDIVLENGKCKDVDGISGSMFMMNAYYMNKYGMYDENIFLYCEEITLGMKLKEAGLKTALLPQYSFVHNHSVSISRTYKSEMKKHNLLIKSKLFVIKQYYGASAIEYLLAKIMSKVSLIETWIWIKIR